MREGLLLYDVVGHLDNLVSLAEIENGPCDFRRMVTRHELDTPSYLMQLLWNGIYGLWCRMLLWPLKATV